MQTPPEKVFRRKKNTIQTSLTSEGVTGCLGTYVWVCVSLLVAVVCNFCNLHGMYIPLKKSCGVEPTDLLGCPS